MKESRNERGNAPSGAVDTVAVGTGGATVERARPALGVSSQWKTHSGSIRLGLEVQRHKVPEGSELRKGRGRGRRGEREYGER